MNAGVGQMAVDLAAWIESTRGAEGYTGPVAHWWRDQIVDCRAGLDWRYEGIVRGYLHLDAVSNHGRWLESGQRAGNDLADGQSGDGHFTRSSFELNPGRGGTPHESAASIALLSLWQRIAGDDPAMAARYLEAARLNLERCLIDRLWDPVVEAFRDDPTAPSLVPNKACTAIEALVRLAEATGDDRYVRRYALPTAEAVLRLQLRRPGSRLDGAIAQNMLSGRIVPKYFPYYAARCIPGLLALAPFDTDGRLTDAALATGRFVARCQEPDGGFPQLLYEDGRVNRYPRWVAAVGDILRAFEDLRPFGLIHDATPAEAWLASGRLPTGGVMIARGFAGHGRTSLPDGPPDLRDYLPVVGWADKAFRWLARSVPRTAKLPAPGARQPLEVECSFGDHRLRLRLDGPSVEARVERRVVYRWRAGTDRPEIVDAWLAGR